MNFLERIDWRVVTPLIALLIGYFLSEWKEYFNRRRKVRNIKKILFTELGDNQGILTTIKRYKIENENDFKMIVDLSEYFSSVVYETYLDRLDTLREREIEALSYAHFQIRTVKKFIIRYSDIIDHPSKYEIPEEKLVVIIKRDLVNTVNLAMRHIFYAMLMMQNKKVPDDAKELDVEQIEDGIEDEIEKALTS